MEAGGTVVAALDGVPEVGRWRDGARVPVRLSVKTGSAHKLRPAWKIEQRRRVLPEHIHTLQISFVVDHYHMGWNLASKVIACYDENPVQACNQGIDSRVIQCETFIQLQR